MTLKGPTLTPVGQLRPGMDDGARVDHPPLSGATMISRGHDLLLADQRAGVEAPDAAHDAPDLRLEHELVARDHRLAEARLVDADEVEERVLVREDPGGDEARMPAVCASASMIITPGITGRPGKWPGKNGSL